MVRSLCFLLLAITSAAVGPFYADAEEPQTWKLHNGPSSPGLALKMISTYDKTTEKVNLHFEMTTPKTRNSPMLDGFALSIITPDIYCNAAGPADDCLPYPSDIDDYPTPSWYTWQASKSMMVSVNNKDKNNAEPCKVSILKNLCDKKRECDELGWKDETMYYNDLKARALKPDDNIIKELEVKDFSSKRTAGRVNKWYTIEFDVTIEDTFFGPEKQWALGLSTGKTIYLGWRMWVQQGRDAVTRGSCNDMDHRETFSNNDPTYSAVLPWTSTQEDQFMGFFKAPPTPAPTKTPTQRPTRSPIQRPTKKPTKTPTQRPTRPTKSPTQRPTKEPTAPTKSPTQFPTRIPTQFPTKKPTAPTQSPTQRPTRNPTQFPTKKPTKNPTQRPTKKPTAPAPSTGPTALVCPKLRAWEKCYRINAWYRFYGSNVVRRQHNIKRSCEENGCHYCGYDINDHPDVMNCRPKKSASGYSYPKSTVCEADPQADIFARNGCLMFPNCPPPEEIKECLDVNDLPFPPYRRFKKKICEITHRCGYYRGYCRPVGDYFYGRKTITRGWFKNQGCPVDAPVTP